MSAPAASPPAEPVVSVDAHEGPVFVAAEHALHSTSARRGTRVDVRRLPTG